MFRNKNINSLGSRFFILLFVSVLILTNIGLPVAGALTPAQLESIRANTAFYDPADISSCSAAGGTTTLSGTKGAEQVYNFLISKGLQEFPSGWVYG